MLKKDLQGFKAAMGIRRQADPQAGSREDPYLLMSGLLEPPQVSRKPSDYRDTAKHRPRVKSESFGGTCVAQVALLPLGVENELNKTSRQTIRTY